MAQKKQMDLFGPQEDKDIYSPLREASPAKKRRIAACCKDMVRALAVLAIATREESDGKQPVTH